MILIQSNFGLFFGRFHSLVVHLPIGFLLLGSIFFFLSRKGNWKFLEKALPLTFLLSTLGAVLAAMMGWFLAKAGGYNEVTLLWHRNLGIATALLSGIFYLHFSGRLGKQGPIAVWGLLASLIVLSITGHLGGQLTHGNDYLLAYAPAFVKNTLSSQKAKNQLTDFPINPDSVFIYQHLIQPIFDQKCTSCHNADQTRGGLNLASTAGLLAGGDHGDVLAPKSEQGPLLLQRVSLEANNPKFMPPKGLSLNYAEIRLLEYWVKNGHSFEQAISDNDLPLAIKKLIKSNYGLTGKPRSYVEMNQVSAADPTQVQALVAEGFIIKKLSQNNNYLEVTYRDSIDCKKLKALVPIQDQITWLNLSNIGLTNDCLAHLRGFSNLTKLKVAQNPIDNEGLLFLKDLQHLESLNLYGTSVDEFGLSQLDQLDQLQYLYVEETKVDSSAKEQIMTQFPMAKIIID